MLVLIKWMHLFIELVPVRIVFIIELILVLRFGPALDHDRRKVSMI